MQCHPSDTPQVIGRIVLEPPPGSSSLLSPSLLRMHGHRFFGGLDPMGVLLKSAEGQGPSGAIRVKSYNNSTSMVTFLAEGAYVHRIIDTSKGQFGGIGGTGGVEAQGEARAALVAALARSCGTAVMGAGAGTGVSPAFITREAAEAKAARSKVLNKKRSKRR